jgi:hypothetical protein
MRKSKLSKVLALTLVFALLISNFTFAAPDSVISNELETNFNVAEETVGMTITYTSPEFIVGKQTEYTVTTKANGDTGKMVRAYFTLPTEASVEYFEVRDSKWYTLGNEYGPLTGFPVSDATSRFRATYTKAGTYTTTVTFKTLDGTVVATKDIIATAVVAPMPAEVTINLPVDGFVVGEKGEFTITTIANADSGLMVIGNSSFANPGAIKTLEYYEVTNNTWYPLSGDFGPSQGFPLANATSKFRVSFNIEGDYAFTVNIREAINHEHIVASKTANFIVKPALVVAEVNVGNLGDLKAALDNDNITIINITADISGVAERLVIDRKLTINGNDHIISYTDAINGLPYGSRHGILISANEVVINDLKVAMTAKAAWQGAYALQAYNATGVELNSFSGTGADAALIVNASEVALQGTTTVSGNEFGGIEVSKGTAAGLLNSALTVSGTLVNSSEEYAKPTVWLVKGQGTVAGTNVPATAIELTKSDNAEQIQYYMVAANTAKFVELTWNIVDNTKGAKVGQQETTIVTAKLAAGVKEVKNARLVIEVSKVGIGVGEFGFTTINGGTATGTPEENAKWLNDTVTDIGDKLVFLWGPEHGTTISSEVATNAGFKFNMAGSYKLNMHLIQVK